MRLSRCPRGVRHGEGDEQGAFLCEGWFFSVRTRESHLAIFLCECVVRLRKMNSCRVDAQVWSLTVDIIHIVVWWIIYLFFLIVRTVSLVRA